MLNEPAKTGRWESVVKGLIFELKKVREFVFEGLAYD